MGAVRLFCIKVLFLIRLLRLLVTSD